MGKPQLQPTPGSDRSLAGDKLLDDSEYFELWASCFCLETNVQFRSWTVRQTADEWRMMTFGRQVGVAVFLVTLTLWIQCIGIAILIRSARASIERGVARLSSLRAAVLMIRFSILVIVLHFLQILLWSVFYRLYCFPSWESSFYFSASSYSTVGYGDVVLPGIFRLLGPIESVTGVLMCGLSVSCLFALASRLIERESGAPPVKYENGSAGPSEPETLNIV